MKIIIAYGSAEEMTAFAREILAERAQTIASYGAEDIPYGFAI